MQVRLSDTDGDSSMWVAVEVEVVVDAKGKWLARLVGAQPADPTGEVVVHLDDEQTKRAKLSIGNDRKTYWLSSHDL